MHLLVPCHTTTAAQTGHSPSSHNGPVDVHGHSAGGTNPSLVEAMYLGLPVFSFDVSYNRTTTEQSAKYFSSAEELKKLLNDVDSQELKVLAHKMKEIANRRYIWSVIAQKYYALTLESLAVDAKRSVKPRLAELSDVATDYQLEHLKHQKMFHEK